MSTLVQIDTALVTDRWELKFRAAPDRANVVAAAVNRRPELEPPHRVLEVRTVYFDTSRADLHALARARASSVSVRVKTYRAVGAAERSKVAWLEVKRTLGTRSRKRRVAMPWTDLPSLVGGGPNREDLVARLQGEQRADACRLSDELGELTRRVGSSLRPTVIASYTREAWQSERAGLRLTIDRDLTFFRPRPELFLDAPALVPAELGAVVGCEADSLVELKSVGPAPGWLHAVLYEQAGPPIVFSKFLVASDALARAAIRVGGDP